MGLFDMQTRPGQPSASGALNPFIPGQLGMPGSGLPGQLGMPGTGLPGAGPAYGPTGIPMSQTTQSAPASLPGTGPSDMMNPTDSAGLGGLDMIGPAPSATDPRAGKYNLAPPAAPPQGISGTTDPAAFAGLDYTPPRPKDAAPGPANAAPPVNSAGGVPPRPDAATDPQRSRQGTLTKDQLDAQWGLMVGGESGGKVGAENPKTHAAGLTQFMPSTLNAWLASPGGQGHTAAEFKASPALQRQAFDWLTQSNATQLEASTGKAPDSAGLAAAHALGAGGAAALMNNPGENAVSAYNASVRAKNGQVALISNNPAWGIRSDDTAAQALGKIGGYYARTSGAAPSASSDAPAATPVSDPAAAGGAPKGPDPAATPAAQPALPDALPGYQPSTQADRYLALAGGIFSGGPNFGAGMGEGIKRMQDMNTADQMNGFKIAQEAANTQLLRQRLGLVAAQAGAIPIKSDQADRKLDQGDASLLLRDAQNQRTHELGMQRVAVQQGRLGLATDNLTATLDGSKAYGGTIGKDSAQTAQRMFGDTTAASGDLQQIEDLRKVIGDNPNAVGGGYVAQASRFLADKFGVDAGVNPDANSVAQKLVAAFANKTAIEGGKGIGGRITQQEFSQFKAASANLGTRPEAWKAMLDTYQAAAQRRLDVASEFSTLRKDPTGYKAALTAPGGLGGWYQDRIEGQNNARGITPTTTPASQYATPPGGGIIHNGGGSNGVLPYTVEKM